MEKVSSIRGLQFKRPVTVKTIAREELKPFIQEAIEDSTGGDVAGYEAWLAHLHLIPEETDLVSVLVPLYESQIAAFYNQKDHVYYAVEDTAGDGFMGEVIALHEFTHALQDQYMEIESTLEALSDNQDAQLALLSLLEGEATLMMAAESLGPENLGQIAQNLEMFAPTAYDIVGDFPPFLVYEMIFPYVNGARFVSGEMGKKMDWSRLNSWYESPPCSTEQILHPENKHTPPADFSSMIEQVKPRGWNTVFHATLGEARWKFIFRKTLEEVPADRAAEGWDGDRIVLFSRKDRQAAVWLTRWDTKKDRKEAEKALNAYFTSEKMRAELFARGRSLAVVTADPGDISEFCRRVRKKLKKMEDLHGHDCIRY